MVALAMAGLAMAGLAMADQKWRLDVLMKKNDGTAGQI